VAILLFCVGVGLGWCLDVCGEFMFVLVFAGCLIIGLFVMVWV